MPYLFPYIQEPAEFIVLLISPSQQQAGCHAKTLTCKIFLFDQKREEKFERLFVPKKAPGNFYLPITPRSNSGFWPISPKIPFSSRLLKKVTMSMPTQPLLS